MAKILMTVDASITRNNGVLRFMIEGSTILHEQGHQVDLLLDTTPADPSIPLTKWFTQVYQTPGDANYPNEIVNGVPEINFLPERVERFKQGYQTTPQDYDMVLGNDLHSSSAMRDLHPNAHHYVHTASLISNENLTFLTDDFIARERELARNMNCFVPTDWMKNNYFPNARRLGLPLTNPEQYQRKTDGRGKGVLFFGEGTYRKGADRYVDVMKTLNLPARVVASSTIEVEFAGLNDLDQRCFGPDETQEKQEFVRECRLMYFPSRGETVSYAVLEACLSQPVVLEQEHNWTQQHTNWCYLTTQEGAEKMIEDIYEEGGDGREQNVRKYIDQSLQDWKDLINPVES